MGKEFLGLDLLERPALFVLDTNCLNRFPLLLVELFPCFITQGVLEEHRRWLSYIETLPSELEGLERELEGVRATLEEARRFMAPEEDEAYWQVFALVVQVRLEGRLLRVRSAQQWQTALDEEAPYFADPLRRAELDHRLKFAAAVLHRASRGNCTVSIVPAGEAGDAEAAAVRELILPAASRLGLSAVPDDGGLRVGQGSEEVKVPLYSFAFLQTRERELRRGEARKKAMEEELKRAVADGELAHAREVVRRIEEQDRVLSPRWDPLAQSLWSYTRYLSKTLAREAVKEFAAALFAQDRDRVREEIIRRYARMSLSAERFTTALDRLLNQVKERELGLKEIQETAETFQDPRSLEVDVGVLRAALSLAEEGEVFIVSDDQDIAELFTLTKQERGRRPVKYVSLEAAVNFSRRIREAFDRISESINRAAAPDVPSGPDL